MAIVIEDDILLFTLYIRYNVCICIIIVDCVVTAADAACKAVSPLGNVPVCFAKKKKNEKK